MFCQRKEKYKFCFVSEGKAGMSMFWHSNVRIAFLGEDCLIYTSSNEIASYDVSKPYFSRLIARRHFQQTFDSLPLGVSNARIWALTHLL